MRVHGQDFAVGARRPADIIRQRLGEQAFAVVGGTGNFRRRFLANLLQVAVTLPVDETFTYRDPRPAVRLPLGTEVIVSFGSRHNDETAGRPDVEARAENLNAADEGDIGDEDDMVPIAGSGRG